MLSSTYSLSDIKMELEEYSYYDYSSSVPFDADITAAIDKAMMRHILPIIGWSDYAELRDLDRNRFNDTTVDTTDGDATCTMDSTTNIMADMYVYGTGIPYGAQVDSITDSTTIELTQECTETNSNITATFSMLTESQYYIYLAENCYAIYEFLRLKGDKALYARRGFNETITERQITRSSSGGIGRKLAAREYLSQAVEYMSLAGYNSCATIQRGNINLYADS